jgi:hypothetical protein
MMNMTTQLKKFLKVVKTKFYLILIWNQYFWIKKIEMKGSNHKSL